MLKTKQKVYLRSLAMKEKAKSIAAMGNKDYYKLLLNVAKENEPAVRKLKRIAQNRVRV